MNQEIEPIHIGEVDDIDQDSVENFEHEEIDYAIFRLKSGFYATQGYCSCDEKALLSEANIEGEELECAHCSKTFNIVSGDPINDPEVQPLKTYEVTEEEGSIYLNI